MPESPETREVPKSLWEKVREHPWAYAGIAASIIIPLIIGTWLLISSAGGFTEYPDEEGSREATSVSDLVTSTTTSPADASESTAVDADDTNRDADTDGKPVYERAPKIAYRLGEKLYVANEDGSSPVEVAPSVRGAFSLSPDGKTLAWVDGVSVTAHVTEVGGTDTAVGPAEDSLPSWAPDSRWLAFTAPGADGTTVRIVGRDGSGERALADGHTPSVSADGSKIALIVAAGPGQVGDVLIVDADGRQRGRVMGAQAIEACCTDEHVIFSVPGSEPGSEEIAISELDGSRQRTLVGPAHLGLPVVYSGLAGSPDGELLLYSASGDDGFSHTYVVEAAPDGTPHSLKVRRDTYQLRWLAGGDRISMVEGNAFQGEPTNVLTVTTEGLGRVVVVAGGGM